MRICEIHIEEFGGISNKTITLDGGFNLLCGANESGKTTLCNFIKYIFYGFSGSDERTEMSNFKTGLSSGYMIIEDGGGMKYRIVRRDTEKSKGRLSVFRESDGSEFSIWKDHAATPGEYFLGVTEKLYTRSIYVSQTGGAALDGGSAEAVSNLLISGDEATNLSKAKNALEGYRKSLRLKKGRGGKIAEAEDSLAHLKEKFERGAKTKEDLAELSASINRLETDKEKLSEQLQSTRTALANIKSNKIHTLLQSKDAIAKEREELLLRGEQIISKYTVDGFLPDENYIRELAAAKNAAEAGKESHESLKAKITSITDQKKQNVPKGYKEYTELGENGDVKERYKKRSTAKRTFELFALFCSILSVASISSFFIPDSFGVQLERSITVAAASTFFSLLFWVLCIRSAVKLYKVNKKLFISSKRPANKAFEEFDTYEKVHGNDFRSFSDALAESEKSADEKQHVLENLLNLWGKASAGEAEDAYYEYLAAKKDVDEKLIELRNSEHFNSAQLSIYSEAEILDAVGKAPNETDIQPDNLSEKSLTELEIKIDNIKGELRELEIRRAEISGGGAPSLNKLSAQIDETEATLKKLNFSYQAVELAIETLEKAEENIRYTVSPYLSEAAGEYFTALTKKRYSGLVLDEKMSLKYKDGETGTPIDSLYLSGGSADLAWICLRLALHKKLSESRPVPIILDECFVYFDDMRLRAILKRLTDIATKNGVQILLFSASSREKDILQKTVNTVKI